MRVNVQSCSQSAKRRLNHGGREDGELHGGGKKCQLQVASCRYLRVRNWCGELRVSDHNQNDYYAIT